MNKFIVFTLILLSSYSNIFGQTTSNLINYVDGDNYEPILTSCGKRPYIENIYPADNTPDTYTYATGMPKLNLPTFESGASWENWLAYIADLSLISETNTIPTNLQMDIYKPEGASILQGGNPCIVLGFGGAFLSGSRTQPELVAFAKELTKKGYVVALPDYRLGFNVANEIWNEYGLSDGEINTLKNASSTRAVYRAVQDMRSAIRYLRANASTFGINPNSIFAGGNSAGGIASLHAAFLNNDIVDNDPLLSSIHGQTLTFSPISGQYTYEMPDLGQLDIGQNLGVSGYPNAVLNLWGAIGKLEWLNTNNTPLISFHGQNDVVVPYIEGSPYGLDVNMQFAGYNFTYEYLPHMYGSASIDNYMDMNDKTSEYHGYWYPVGSGHELWNSTTNFNAIVNETAEFLSQFVLPTNEFSLLDFDPENLYCPNTNILFHFEPIGEDDELCFENVTGDAYVVSYNNSGEIIINFGAAGTDILNITKKKKNSTSTTNLYRMNYMEVTVPDILDLEYMYMCINSPGCIYGIIAPAYMPNTEIIEGKKVYDYKLSQILNTYKRFQDGDISATNLESYLKFYIQSNNNDQCLTPSTPISWKFNNGVTTDILCNNKEMYLFSNDINSMNGFFFDYLLNTFNKVDESTLFKVYAEVNGQIVDSIYIRIKPENLSSNFCFAGINRIDSDNPIYEMPIATQVQQVKWVVLKKCDMSIDNTFTINNPKSITCIGNEPRIVIAICFSGGIACNVIKYDDDIDENINFKQVKCFYENEIEENKLIQDLSKASVSIHGGGIYCSGTLIDYKQDEFYLYFISSKDCFKDFYPNKYYINFNNVSSSCNAAVAPTIPPINIPIEYVSYGGAKKNVTGTGIGEWRFFNLGFDENIALFRVRKSLIPECVCLAGYTSELLLEDFNGLPVNIIGSCQENNGLQSLKSTDMISALDFCQNIYLSGKGVNGSGIFRREDGSFIASQSSKRIIDDYISCYPISIFDLENGTVDEDDYLNSYHNFVSSYQSNSFSYEYDPFFSQVFRSYIDPPSRVGSPDCPCESGSCITTFTPNFEHKLSPKINDIDYKDNYDSYLPNNTLYGEMKTNVSSYNISPTWSTSNCTNSEKTISWGVFLNNQDIFQSEGNTLEIPLSIVANLFLDGGNSNQVMYRRKFDLDPNFQISKSLEIRCNIDYASGEDEAFKFDIVFGSDNSHENEIPISCVAELMEEEGPLLFDLNSNMVGLFIREGEGESDIESGTGVMVNTYNNNGHLYALTNGHLFNNSNIEDWKFYFNVKKSSCEAMEMPNLNELPFTTIKSIITRSQELDFNDDDPQVMLSYLNEFNDYALVELELQAQMPEDLVLAGWSVSPPSTFADPTIGDADPIKDAYIIGHGNGYQNVSSVDNTGLKTAHEYEGDMIFGFNEVGEYAGYSFAANEGCVEMSGSLGAPLFSDDYNFLIGLVAGKYDFQNSTDDVDPCGNPLVNLCTSLERVASSDELFKNTLYNGADLSLQNINHQPIKDCDVSILVEEDEQDLVGTDINGEDVLVLDESNINGYVLGYNYTGTCPMPTDVYWEVEYHGGIMTFNTPQLTLNNSLFNATNHEVKIRCHGNFLNAHKSVAILNIKRKHTLACPIALKDENSSTLYTITATVGNSDIAEEYFILNSALTPTLQTTKSKLSEGISFSVSGLDCNTEDYTVGNNGLPLITWTNPFTNETSELFNYTIQSNTAEAGEYQIEVNINIKGYTAAPLLFLKVLEDPETLCTQPAENSVYNSTENIPIEFIIEPTDLEISAYRYTITLDNVVGATSPYKAVITGDLQTDGSPNVINLDLNSGTNNFVNAENEVLDFTTIDYELQAHTNIEFGNYTAGGFVDLYAIACNDFTIIGQAEIEEILNSEGEEYINRIRLGKNKSNEFSANLKNVKTNIPYHFKWVLLNSTHNLVHALPVQNNEQTFISTSTDYQISSTLSDVLIPSTDEELQLLYGSGNDFYLALLASENNQSLQDVEVYDANSIPENVLYKEISCEVRWRFFNLDIYDKDGINGSDDVVDDDYYNPTNLSADKIISKRNIDFDINNNDLILLEANKAYQFKYSLTTNLDISEIGDGPLYFNTYDENGAQIVMAYSDVDVDNVNDICHENLTPLNTISHCMPMVLNSNIRTFEIGYGDVDASWRISEPKSVSLIVLPIDLSFKYNSNDPNNSEGVFVNYATIYPVFEYVEGGNTITISLNVDATELPDYMNNCNIVLQELYKDDLPTGTGTNLVGQGFSYTLNNLESGTYRAILTIGCEESTVEPVEVYFVILSSPPVLQYRMEPGGNINIIEPYQEGATLTQIDYDFNNYPVFEFDINSLPSDVFNAETYNIYWKLGDIVLNEDPSQSFLTTFSLESYLTNGIEEFTIVLEPKNFIGTNYTYKVKVNNKNFTGTATFKQLVAGGVSSNLFEMINTPITIFINDSITANPNSGITINSKSYDYKLYSYVNSNIVRHIKTNASNVETFNLDTIRLIIGGDVIVHYLLNGIQKSDTFKINSKIIEVHANTAKPNHLDPKCESLLDNLNKNAIVSFVEKSTGNSFGSGTLINNKNFQLFSGNSIPKLYILTARHLIADYKSGSQTLRPGDLLQNTSISIQNNNCINNSIIYTPFIYEGDIKIVAVLPTPMNYTYSEDTLMLKSDMMLLEIVDYWRIPPKYLSLLGYDARNPKTDFSTNVNNIFFGFGYPCSENLKYFTANNDLMVYFQTPLPLNDLVGLNYYNLTFLINNGNSKSIFKLKDNIYIPKNHIPIKLLTGNIENGMSGGPLLLNDMQDVYKIVGVNSSVASHRNGHTILNSFPDHVSCNGGLAYSPANNTNRISTATSLFMNYHEKTLLQNNYNITEQDAEFSINLKQYLDPNNILTNNILTESYNFIDHWLNEFYFRLKINTPNDFVLPSNTISVGNIDILDTDILGMNLEFDPQFSYFFGDLDFQEQSTVTYHIDAPGTEFDQDIVYAGANGMTPVSLSNLPVGITTVTITLSDESEEEFFGGVSAHIEFNINVLPTLEVNYASSDNNNSIGVFDTLPNITYFNVNEAGSATNANKLDELIFSIDPALLPSGCASALSINIYKYNAAGVVEYFTTSETGTIANLPVGYYKAIIQIYCDELLYSEVEVKFGITPPCSFKYEMWENGAPTTASATAISMAEEGNELPLIEFNDTQYPNFYFDFGGNTSYYNQDAFSIEWKIEGIPLDYIQGNFSPSLLFDNAYLESGETYEYSASITNIATGFSKEYKYNVRKTDSQVDYPQVIGNNTINFNNTEIFTFEFGEVLTQIQEITNGNYSIEGKYTLKDKSTGEIIPLGTVTSQNLEISHTFNKRGIFLMLLQAKIIDNNSGAILAEYNNLKLTKKLFVYDKDPDLNCLKSLKCPQYDDVSTYLKGSTVKIYLGEESTGSGILITNYNVDFEAGEKPKNYILTANHVIKQAEGTELSQLPNPIRFEFNYHSSCTAATTQEGSQTPESGVFTYDKEAIVVKSSGNNLYCPPVVSFINDMCLIELTGDLPPTVCYSGWDATNPSTFDLDNETFFAAGFPYGHCSKVLKGVGIPNSFIVKPYLLEIPSIPLNQICNNMPEDENVILPTNKLGIKITEGYGFPGFSGSGITRASGNYVIGLLTEVPQGPYVSSLGLTFSGLTLSNKQLVPLQLCTDENRYIVGSSIFYNYYTPTELTDMGIAELDAAPSINLKQYLDPDNEITVGQSVKNESICMSEKWTDDPDTEENDGFIFRLFKWLFGENPPAEPQYNSAEPNTWTDITINQGQKLNLKVDFPALFEGFVGDASYQQNNKIKWELDGALISDAQELERIIENFSVGTHTVKITCNGDPIFYLGISQHIQFDINVVPNCELEIKDEDGNAIAGVLQIEEANVANTSFSLVPQSNECSYTDISLSINNGTSFLCNLPTVPDMVASPGMEPYSFNIAQIGCSDLAPGSYTLRVSYKLNGTGSLINNIQYLQVIPNSQVYVTTNSYVNGEENLAGVAVAYAEEITVSVSVEGFDADNYTIAEFIVDEGASSAQAYMFNPSNGAYNNLSSVSGADAQFKIFTPASTLVGHWVLRSALPNYEDIICETISVGNGVMPIPTITTPGSGLNEAPPYNYPQAFATNVHISDAYCSPCYLEFYYDGLLQDAFSLSAGGSEQQYYIDQGELYDREEWASTNHILSPGYPEVPTPYEIKLFQESGPSRSMVHVASLFGVTPAPSAFNPLVTTDMIIHAPCNAGDGVYASNCNSNNYHAVITSGSTAEINFNLEFVTDGTQPFEYQISGLPSGNINGIIGSYTELTFSDVFEESTHDVLVTYWSVGSDPSEGKQELITITVSTEPYEESEEETATSASADNCQIELEVANNLNNIDLQNGLDVGISLSDGCTIEGDFNYVIEILNNGDMHSYTVPGNSTSVSNITFYGDEDEAFYMALGTNNITVYIDNNSNIPVYHGTIQIDQGSGLNSFMLKAPSEWLPDLSFDISVGQIPGSNILFDNYFYCFEIYKSSGDASGPFDQFFTSFQTDNLNEIHSENIHESGWYEIRLCIIDDNDGSSCLDEGKICIKSIEKKIHIFSGASLTKSISISAEPNEIWNVNSSWPYKVQPLIRLDFNSGLDGPIRKILIEWKYKPLSTISSDSILAMQWLTVTDYPIGNTNFANSAPIFELMNGSPTLQIAPAGRITATVKKAVRLDGSEVVLFSGNGPQTIITVNLPPVPYWAGSVDCDFQDINDPTNPEEKDFFNIDMWRSRHFYNVDLGGWDWDWYGDFTLGLGSFFNAGHYTSEDGILGIGHYVESDIMQYNKYWKNTGDFKIDEENKTICINKNIDRFGISLQPDFSINDEFGCKIYLDEKMAFWSFKNVTQNKVLGGYNQAFNPHEFFTTRCDLGKYEYDPSASSVPYLNYEQNGQFLNILHENPELFISESLLAFQANCVQVTQSEITNIPVPEGYNEYEIEKGVNSCWYQTCDGQTDVPIIMPTKNVSANKGFDLFWYTEGEDHSSEQLLIPLTNQYLSPQVPSDKSIEEYLIENGMNLEDDYYIEVGLLDASTNPDASTNKISNRYKVKFVDVEIVPEVSAEVDNIENGDMDVFAFYRQVGCGTQEPTVNQNYPEDPYNITNLEINNLNCGISFAPTIDFSSWYSLYPNLDVAQIDEDLVYNYYPSEYFEQSTLENAVISFETLQNLPSTFEIELMVCNTFNDYCETRTISVVNPYQRIEVEVVKPNICNKEENFVIVKSALPVNVNLEYSDIVSLNEQNFWSLNNENISSSASDYNIELGDNDQLWKLNYAFFNTFPVNVMVDVVINLNSCVDTQDVSFVIHPNIEQIPYSIVDNNICSGEQINLQLPLANNYVWSSSGNSITGGSSGTISNEALSIHDILTLNGSMPKEIIYTIESKNEYSTNGGHCYKELYVPIVVNSLPTLSIEASSNEVCANEPFTINATGSHWKINTLPAEVSLIQSYMTGVWYNNNGSPLWLSFENNSSESKIVTIKTKGGCNGIEEKEISIIIHPYGVSSYPDIIESNVCLYGSTNINDLIEETLGVTIGDIQILGAKIPNINTGDIEPYFGSDIYHLNLNNDEYVYSNSSIDFPFAEGIHEFYVSITTEDALCGQLLILQLNLDDTVAFEPIHVYEDQICADDILTIAIETNINLIGSTNTYAVYFYDQDHNEFHTSFQIYNTTDFINLTVNGGIPEGVTSFEIYVTPVYIDDMPMVGDNNCIYTTGLVAIIDVVEENEIVCDSIIYICSGSHFILEEYASLPCYDGEYNLNLSGHHVVYNSHGFYEIVEPGIYTITAIDPNNPETPIASTQVEIIPVEYDLPIVQGDTTFCTSSSELFTIENPNAAVDYTWSIEGGANISNITGSSVVVNMPFGITSSILTLTSSINGGCVQEQVFNLNICESMNCDGIVLSLSTSSICSNEPIFTTIPLPAGTYNWEIITESEIVNNNPDNLLSGQIYANGINNSTFMAINNPFPTAINATLTITPVVGSVTCTASQTFEILPSSTDITIEQGENLICHGDTAKVNLSVGIYTWEITDWSSATLGSQSISGIINVESEGLYPITVLHNFGDALGNMTIKIEPLDNKTCYYKYFTYNVKPKTLCEDGGGIIEGNGPIIVCGTSNEEVNLTNYLLINSNNVPSNIIWFVKTSREELIQIGESKGEEPMIVNTGTLLKYPDEVIARINAIDGEIYDIYIKVLQAVPPKVELYIKNATCNADGSLSIINNSTEKWEYSLDGGKTWDTKMYYSLIPRSYTLLVKGDNGCIFNYIFEIKIENEIKMNYTINEGIVYVEGIGGSGSYVYSFDGGKTYLRTNYYAIQEGEHQIHIQVLDIKTNCIVSETINIIDIIEEIIICEQDIVDANIIEVGTYFSMNFTNEGEVYEYYVKDEKGNIVVLSKSNIPTAYLEATILSSYDTLYLSITTKTGERKFEKAKVRILNVPKLEITTTSTLCQAHCIEGIEVTNDNIKSTDYYVKRIKIKPLPYTPIYELENTGYVRHDIITDTLGTVILVNYYKDSKWKLTIINADKKDTTWINELGQISSSCNVEGGSVSATSDTKDLLYSFDKGISWSINSSKVGLISGTYTLLVDNQGCITVHPFTIECYEYIRPIITSENMSICYQGNEMPKIELSKYFAISNNEYVKEYKYIGIDVLGKEYNIVIQNTQSYTVPAIDLMTYTSIRLEITTNTNEIITSTIEVKITEIPNYYIEEINAECHKSNYGSIVITSDKELIGVYYSIDTGNIWYKSNIIENIAKGEHLLTIDNQRCYTTIPFKIECNTMALQDVELEIFPNPTSGKITILIPYNFATDVSYTLEVLDTKFNQILYTPLSTNNIVLNLGGLNIGYYYIRVVDSNKNSSQVFKIFKK